MISRFLNLRIVFVLFVIFAIPANSYSTHLDPKTPQTARSYKLSPGAQNALLHPPQRLSRQLKDELTDVLRQEAEPVLRSFLKNRFDKMAFIVNSAQLQSGNAIHFSAQGISADHPQTKIVLELFYKGGNQAVDEYYGRWFEPTVDRDGWIRRYRFPMADLAAHTNLKDERTEAFYWQRGEYYIEVWSARQVKVFAQQVNATLESNRFYEFAKSLHDHADGRGPGQNSRSKRLTKAIKDQNLDRVNRLIRRGVDLKGTPGELPPLALAADLGHGKILDALIRAGADVNAIGPNGANALYKAVEKNRTFIVRKLIKAGSEINFKDDKGATLLAIAAKHGNAKTLRPLIKAGADVNGARLYLTESPVYRTPLMVAAKNDQPISVIVLLNSKANPDLHGDRGITPLMIAARNGWRDIVLTLLAGGADSRISNDRGKTAYTIAEENGHENIVMIFKDLSRKLHKGPNDPGRFERQPQVDESRRDSNSNGSTLPNGNFQSNNNYQENKIEPVKPKQKSLTANLYKPRENSIVQNELISAGKDGDTSHLFDLIDSDKGNINGPDSGGNTPLMFAAFHGHGSMVNTLLNETSADVNWANNDGNTALLYAAQRGNDWIVNTLILAGAKVDHKNKKGKTALNYATEQRHSNVVLTLKEARNR
ncbi:MAG: ankyrin repeat domain-containing protein [Nitrospinales bacterium]